jgi:hypothetical protein
VISAAAHRKTAETQARAHYGLREED